MSRLLSALSTAAFYFGAVLACLVLLLPILKRYLIRNRQTQALQDANDNSTAVPEIVNETNMADSMPDDNLPVAKRVKSVENASAWHRIGREEQTYNRL